VNKRDISVPIDAMPNWAAPSPAQQWKSTLPTYDSDYLIAWNRNFEFLRNPEFLAAYRAGINSGHSFLPHPGADPDIHIEFRAYVACWAASHALRLSGDFVECGVNTGIYSLSICKLLDFNATSKTFWLFDTFSGIPEWQLSESEQAAGIARYNKLYPECWERAQRNFSPYPKVRLIRGVVPESLGTVEISEVSYLSLDMNVAYPERAAIEYFWPKIVKCGVVILDDYAWTGHLEQKSTLDKFAQSVGHQILTLPTGQGLLIKL
jgi:O-methyltransferase